MGLSGRSFLCLAGDEEQDWSSVKEKTQSKFVSCVFSALMHPLRHARRRKAGRVSGYHASSPSLQDATRSVHAHVYRTSSPLSRRPYVAGAVAGPVRFVSATARIRQRDWCGSRAYRDVSATPTRISVVEAYMAPCVTPAVERTQKSVSAWSR